MLVLGSCTAVHRAAVRQPPHQHMEVQLNTSCVLVVGSSGDLQRSCKRTESRVNPTARVTAVDIITFTTAQALPAVLCSTCSGAALPSAGCSAQHACSSCKHLRQQQPLCNLETWRSAADGRGRLRLHLPQAIPTGVHSSLQYELIGHSV
jgi:hypothetical protein